MGPNNYFKRSHKGNFSFAQKQWSLFIIFVALNGIVLRKLFQLFIILIQFTTINAQKDCSSIATFTEGKEWVYQWYGANNKPSFKSYAKVVSSNGDSSLVQLVIINAFENTVYQGDYYVQCTGTGLHQDLIAKLTPDMLQSMDGLEIRTGKLGWILPHGLKAGDSIPQSYAHFSGFANNIKILDLDISIGPVNIFDREDLTTPAGGFPCMTMSYELWITQMTRKRFKLRDWISPGVGIIRREVFDRRGHYFGYCELIAYKA